MQSLQFHPLAEIEADEASLYYEEISIPLAARYFDNFTSGLNHIADFPESFPVQSGRIRKYVLSDFPYSLFYAILKSGLYIVAVAHHRRRPNYWKHRLKDLP